MSEDALSALDAHRPLEGQAATHERSKDQEGAPPRTLRCCVAVAVKDGPRRSTNSLLVSAPRETEQWPEAAALCDLSSFREEADVCAVVAQRRLQCGPQKYSGYTFVRACPMRTREESHDVCAGGP